MSYENLILNNDGSYTFDKNGMPYNCPNFGEWEEEFAQIDKWAKENPSMVGSPPPPPEPPTMAEMAKGLMMTKAEFLILVTGLTKDFETPITLEAIETYLANDADIRMRFTYANHVERSHPLLNTVTESFGITTDLLDIMFVQKDELIKQIESGEALS